jgi:hypothetical protein
MTFTVNVVANGWSVEIWRGRVDRTVHVFTDRDALMAFLTSLLEGH